MAPSRLLTDLKSLAGKSVVYGAGSILLRAINFLLIPLYTRYLTPADYGIMAVTGTITSVLNILLPLSLHSAAGRFYFLAQSEDERRKTNGTIWVTMVLFALGSAVLLDRFGGIVFPIIFRDISFALYVRPTIWISFLSTFGLLPLVFLQVQERPVSYVVITISSALLTIGLVIYFVVFQKRGAYGYLLGTLLALALFAVPYIILTLRNVQIAFRWGVLKAAFAFSLPLLPHSLAGWVLQLSDRVILQRFVPLGELGLYSLGYQFGIVMSLAATAVNFAWVPFLYKTDAQRGEAAKPHLARLATYYTFYLCFVALGLMLCVKDVILVVAAPGFQAAHRVSPLIIGGLLWDGLYYVPVNFLFLKGKTKLIPIVTVSSGLVNIGLNLWLTPRYGIMAAAWATFFSFGLMLVLAWILALRNYPFPYEYKRLGLIVLAGAFIFMVGGRIQLASVLVDLVLKGVLLLSYPLILVVLGFLTPSEKRMALVYVQQLLITLRRVIYRA